MILCYIFRLFNFVEISVCCSIPSPDTWISKSQIVPFDPTKKKKKKKITIVDPADDPVEKLAEKTDNLTGMQK